MPDSKNRGFIVHAASDRRHNRLYMVGRLTDGRSFAAIESRHKPAIYLRRADRERAAALLSSYKFELTESDYSAFEKTEMLYALKFDKYAEFGSAVSRLEENGIYCPNADLKPAEAFLAERGIKGTVEITGAPEKGRLVNIIFRNAEIKPCDEISPLDVPLKLCSIDIETNVSSGTILAIGISVTPLKADDQKSSLVRVLHPQGSDDVKKSETENIFFHNDEKSLLVSFLDDIRKADPDCLTGWNFLDFDYPKLAERCEYHKIPFTLGRSSEAAIFFAGGGDYTNSMHGRRGSAAAYVPGRQVLDALRIVRSGPQHHSSYTLEAVAQSILGTGKEVASTGKDKIAELEKLYSDDLAAFGSYCLKDAELVLDILEKTGLWRLSLERASLTGVSIDKAWTSVVSFERIYGLELLQKKIVPPNKISGKDVSGAAGGTVLDPSSGIFHNVGVFDFRSLYPTIMRTFNIDPLSFARAGREGIKAPNGAVFSREPGILPGLIESFFAARKKALDKGDNEASYVYKILMNSFYGVLGTSSCRYGRTELAGAITSFARKWLLFSRDWFTKKGYTVLYGDTDSLFVESGLTDSASYGNFLEWGNTLCGELNKIIVCEVEKEYDLRSFLELRFEKPYRRFMIPPLRSVKNAEGRGRAKGYGAWVIDPEGKNEIEVKGMEAVRSDSTALARRIQIELLELVFKGSGENDLKDYVNRILTDMRHGRLDDELIYRKRLSRPPEEYTSSTPPQVKAARALGWKNRRGTVEYYWTVSGPLPVEMRVNQNTQLDYDHYTDAQVLSVARSIASAAGWNNDIFPHNKNDHLSDAQIEFGFQENNL